MRHDPAQGTPRWLSHIRRLDAAAAVRLTEEANGTTTASRLRFATVVTLCWAAIVWFAMAIPAGFGLDGAAFAALYALAWGIPVLRSAYWISTADAASLARRRARHTPAQRSTRHHAAGRSR